MNDIEQLGRTQTAATKKKIAKALMGDKNPAYDEGQRSYREKIHAPKGKVVHHKDGDRGNNAPSNLEITSKANNDKIHHREDNFNKSGGRKPVSTKHKSIIRK